MNNRHAIECRGLEKTFRRRAVLKGIHFQVREGEILALVGSNGAGKTTLLKVLSTLITPSGGSAAICGKDVVGDPMGVRKRMGFVLSEDRSFYWRLTGRQNLEFFAALHRMDRKEAGRRIDSLLEAVGLAAKADSPFREYSSGMRQVLGIARGMLHDPSVLLLDEPTRSLSPEIAKKARRLLREQAGSDGKAILIASHNLKEVEEIADHIAIIHEGGIRAIGTLDELKLRAGLGTSSELDAVFEHFTHRDPIV